MLGLVERCVLLSIPALSWVRAAFGRVLYGSAAQGRQGETFLGIVAICRVIEKFSKAKVVITGSVKKKVTHFYLMTLRSEEKLSTSATKGATMFSSSKWNDAQRVRAEQLEAHGTVKVPYCTVPGIHGIGRFTTSSRI